MCQCTTVYIQILTFYMLIGHVKSSLQDVQWRLFTISSRTSRFYSIAIYVLSLYFTICMFVGRSNNRLPREDIQCCVCVCVQIIWEFDINTNLNFNCIKINLPNIFTKHLHQTISFSLSLSPCRFLLINTSNRMILDNYNK